MVKTNFHEEGLVPPTQFVFRRVVEAQLVLFAI